MSNNEDRLYRFGIPVITDNSILNNEIRFYLNGQVVGKIINIDNEKRCLKTDRDKLKDILINEYGACPECIEAKLAGFTICGDCYS
jgi:hypothetical protein